MNNKKEENLQLKRIRKRRIRKIPQVNSVQSLINPLFNTLPEEAGILNQLALDYLKSFLTIKEQNDISNWRTYADDNTLRIPSPFESHNNIQTKKNKNSNHLFDDILYLTNCIIQKNELIAKKMFAYRIPSTYLFRTIGTKYAILNKEKKKHIVCLSNKIGINTMAKSLSLSKKSVERWRSNGIERKKGGGRKTLDPNMEAQLIEWYNNQIALGKIITPAMIKYKAKVLSCVKTFQASYGWYEKFKKKYKIDRNKNKVQPINIETWKNLFKVL